MNKLVHENQQKEFWKNEKNIFYSNWSQKVENDEDDS